MLSRWLGCNVDSMLVLVAIVDLPLVRTTIELACLLIGSTVLGAIAARLVWMKAYAGVTVRIEHLCSSYYATPRACEKHLGGTMMMLHRSCTSQEQTRMRHSCKSPVPDQCSPNIVYLCLLGHFRLSP